MEETSMTNDNSKLEYIEPSYNTFSTACLINTSGNVTTYSTMLNNIMGESTTDQGNLTAISDMETRKIFGTENNTTKSSTIFKLGFQTIMNHHIIF